MGYHPQSTKVFEREVSANFVTDFTRGLSNVYRKTHLETQNFLGPYQRYMRSHILRAYTEEAFLRSAQRHKLMACVPCNSKGDAHGLVIDGRYVITVSRTTSPNTPPRPARFRATYAAYCDLGQLPLPGPYFSIEQQRLIPISDRSHPLYVLITHGPKKNDWREVGFVYANVVVPRGKGFRFFGPGLNLLETFGTKADIATEQVPEPQVDLRSNEVADIGAGQS